MSEFFADFDQQKLVRSVDHCDQVARKILSSGDAMVIDDDMAGVGMVRDNDSGPDIGEVWW